MANVTVLNTDSTVSAKTLIVAEGAATITGLQTFDRDPNAPFAVTASSAVVPNLDADKLDGLDSLSFARVDATSNFTDNIVQRPVLKDYAETLNALGNITGATSIDLETGNHFSGTMTGNCTFTFSNPSPTGKACAFLLTLTQDGTGSRTATWPAAVKWPAATAPTLTTTASKVDIVGFYTLDAGTTWRGYIVGQNYA